MMMRYVTGNYFASDEFMLEKRRQYDDTEKVSHARRQSQMPSK